MLEDYVAFPSGAYTPPLWTHDRAEPPGAPSVAWLLAEEDASTYGTARHAPAFPGIPSSLVRLALSDDVGTAQRQHAREDLAHRTLGEIDLLARAHAALAIRQGQLLAHMKRFDSAELGYPSFARLRDALSDWNTTWTRSIVRLVDSDLRLIVDFTRLGRIPLSAAVQAPGRLQPDQQVEWIIDVLQGSGPWQDGDRLARTVDIDGDAMATVHAARNRVRLLDGTELSNLAADHFILETWRARLPGDDLVRQARQPRPPPTFAPLADFLDLDDPADRLLGPFEAPADLGQACTMLQEVQALTRDRGHRIGLLWKRFTDHDLQQALGHRTLHGLVRDMLNISLRQLQEYRCLADELELTPQLQVAYDQGMAVDKILRVASIATEDTVDRWLAVARRTGITALRRGVGLARDCGANDVLASFEQAIRRMKQLGGGQAQDTVALQAAMRPAPGPTQDRVHPDLPRAAAWFLDHVLLPAQRGCGRIKEAQHYVCQNPECNRRWLGNHAHHILPRSQGGSDDDDNLNTHCPSCHLRLLHTGRVRCIQLEEALLWTYPGRRIWVF